MSQTIRVVDREERFVRLLEKTGLYRFFSQLFAASPSPWLIQDIVEYNLLTTAYHFHETFGEPRRLEDDGWVRVADVIAVEFTCLFSAPGEHYIPPYESFYIDELHIEQAEDPGCRITFPGGSWKGFIGQRSASEVRILYETAGLEMNPEFHDLPDHISVELDFLAHLTSRQTDALEQGLLEVTTGYASQEEDFRHSHLDRWCSIFLERVISNPISHFYRQIAIGLDGFLTRALSDRAH